jgi:hypothetical protein
MGYFWLRNTRRYSVEYKYYWWQMSITRTLQFPDARYFLQRTTEIPWMLEGYEDVTVAQGRGSEICGMYPGCCEISRRLCCVQISTVTDQTTPVHSLFSSLCCLYLPPFAIFAFTVFSLSLLPAPFYSYFYHLISFCLPLFSVIFYFFLVTENIHRARWIEL